jgi:DNA-binding winged helix-turn-helix (wHTH) protein
MDLVWPDTAVEENLAQSIGAIRKALGEQPGDQRYVLTVPGRCYSFVADIDEPTTAETHPGRRRLGLSATALSLGALLIGAALIWT